MKIWSHDEDRLLGYYYSVCKGNWKMVAE